MSALIRMRLAGFVRGGRILAPLIVILLELGFIGVGGASPAAAAYGFSSVLLFPALAWLTKLLLDTEPDVQRRITRTALGARREAVAGALAAAVASLAVCAVAIGTPWLLNGIDLKVRPLSGTAVGIVAHLLIVPPAVALGALASRAVTRSVRSGIVVLVSAAVLVVVLGLKGSLAPWLVPPVMATARALNEESLPSAGTLLLYTGWSVVWCTAAFGCYGWMRRARA